MGDRCKYGNSANSETNQRLGYKGSSPTHLHATNPDTQRPACRPVTFLPLTLFLRWRRVHPILPRPHLKVQHARLLELSGQVFHQNEVVLARGGGRSACRGSLGGEGRRYQVSGKFTRGRCRHLQVTPSTRNSEGETRGKD